MTCPLSRCNWPVGGASAEEVLCWGIDEFGRGLAICTSLQATGSVIIDMAARLTGGDVKVFTIDTGRLHQETYELIDQVRVRYGIEVELVRPEARELTSMLNRHGRNLFYESGAKRRLCCEIRKVRPLNRKLATLEAWVVGLRRTQSGGREHIEQVSIDEEHGGIVKLAPLADWTDEEVFEYIERNDVPVHALYAKGYSSIGCLPCTRAIRPGEPARAGRWWWEKGEEKECGIHVSSNGKLQRDFDLLGDEVVPPGQIATAESGNP